MWWADVLQANKDFTKFRVTPTENYEGMEARMNRLYLGKSLNEKLQVDGGNKITFRQMKRVLLSRGEGNDEIKKLKMQLDSGSCFLNGGGLENRVICASVPRSGNSFLRRLLENITGIATGSDVSLRSILNLTLQQIGFSGEEITDERIWICKSHYPLTLPDDQSQFAKKVICCVRNPIDVIASEYNCQTTWTHSE